MDEVLRIRADLKALQQRSDYLLRENEMINEDCGYEYRRAFYLIQNAKISLRLAEKRMFYDIMNS